MIKHIDNSLKDAVKNITEFAADKTNISVINKIATIIAQAFHNSNKVLICGNGGSSTDAMHFAEELTGRFRQERPALPAIALTDPSHITCVANDYGFNEIFSRSVAAYGKKEDVLIAISTSGNSKNVINAVDKANEMGMITFGLLGKDGGILNDKCDIQLIAPGITTDRVQEIHITILHLIIEIIERILYPKNYQDQ